MKTYDEELMLLTSDDEGLEAETEAIAEPRRFSYREPLDRQRARRPPERAGKGSRGSPLGPAPTGTRPIRREEIRLDVDGRYPQMTVSGTISGFLITRIHWIARLTKNRGQQVVRSDLVQGRRGGVVPLHRGRGHGTREPIPESPLRQDQVLRGGHSEADCRLQVPLEVLPHGQLRVRLPAG